MWHSRKYTFDTSKLMIVGMGSWSRIELIPDKVVGFEQKSKPKQYKDLTTDDFIKKWYDTRTNRKIPSYSTNEN